MMRELQMSKSKSVLFVSVLAMGLAAAPVLADEFYKGKNFHFRRRLLAGRRL